MTRIGMPGLGKRREKPHALQAGIVACAALWISMGQSGCSDAPTPATVPEAVSVSSDAPAAPFPTVDLEGLKRRIAELEGSVVVVDFWGTWCPRCREQLPQVLLSLARANESRGVKLLTVALERPGDLPLAEKFLADQAFVPPHRGLGARSLGQELPRVRDRRVLRAVLPCVRPERARGRYDRGDRIRRHAPPRIGRRRREGRTAEGAVIGPPAL